MAPTDNCLQRVDRLCCVMGWPEEVGMGLGPSPVLGLLVESWLPCPFPCSITVLSPLHPAKLLLTDPAPPGEGAFPQDSVFWVLLLYSGKGERARL